jgi:hypothetical protein
MSAASIADTSAALARIRQERLYREDYATWEDYCRERWGMSRRHADRLIDRLQIVEELDGPDEEENGPIGPFVDAPTPLRIYPQPERESRARPLKALPDRQTRRQVWQRAVESTGGAQPTAALVQRLVDDAMEALGAEKAGEVRKAQAATRRGQERRRLGKALRLLDEVRELLEGWPTAERWLDRLVEEILALQAV